MTSRMEQGLRLSLHLLNRRTEMTNRKRETLQQKFARQIGVIKGRPTPEEILARAAEKGK